MLVQTSVSRSKHRLSNEGGLMPKASLLLLLLLLFLFLLLLFCSDDMVRQDPFEILDPSTKTGVRIISIAV